MLYKQISSVTIILLVVMTCGAVLLLGQPAGTFASRVEVEVIGGKYELSVTEHGSAGMENMAPGDWEESMVTVRNDGDEEFAVAVSAVKTGGDDEFFRHLKVTVKDGDTVLQESSMAEVQNLPLGTFAAGESRDYTFLVEFPREAGNEFQDAEITMKWVFTAEWPDPAEPGEEPGGEEPGEEPGEEEPGGSPVGPGPEDEGLIPIEEEEVPAAPLEPGEGAPEWEPEDKSEEEKLVPLEEEEVPGGPVKMPKTGERPPLLFYGLGLTLVAGGLALGRKRAKQ